ncbi:acetyl-CoA acetyltransferase [Rhodococcus sp. 15-725-2-2b]|uniref:thiolase family protein n=1 Tax=unclassified Rhodococcus (in: high G+C Gram-positive bacteria) TaxID=192944 RepID=UPI000B9C6882|nr:MULTISPECIES: thiolase family protein [unclassified Rhodococcus (in: high G+C Gram-positive bacteria)]OZC63601.1 acetyl-CoA acetyltransferase [Rhodococcus sp. 06-469-3-2]OZD40766.1 acetyl-CoA acetyltransferase [Rhodococcus sp. 06-1477-1A]OZE67126.1 acetyl-CoA acetyltransferase [Rhodococcus sp. 15-725-2-2b]
MSERRDAVIVEAVRSPVGRRGGTLSSVHPVDLSARVLQALVERTGLDPALIDDVIWGCVTQAGEQAGNIGRYAALAAGWPETVPGTTVDRQCGSSQQAISFAAASVMSGQQDFVVAGGVESMSRVPMGWARINGPGSAFGPLVTSRYGTNEFNQGAGAELLAYRGNFTREALDAYSLESHRRAAAAIDEGRFVREIEPIETTGPDGSARLVDTDEGVRRDGTLERLAKLPTPFAIDGTVSAGNASQISDGAAALLITTSEIAKRHGLRTRARLTAFSVIGDDPLAMLYAPIPATRMVLDRAGLQIGEIGTFEVNEAFASVNLTWLSEFGVPHHLVNPDGGAIALGHPMGGSGARLMTTMLHRMEARGIRYGLQTMCEGGGTANATIIELSQV